MYLLVLALQYAFLHIGNIRQDILIVHYLYYKKQKLNVLDDAYTHLIAL